MKRRLIRVFEHGVLRVSEQGLSKPDFDALVRFNQCHGDRFFVVRHESLKFTSYVGALRVGSLTIEILPKADRAEEGGQDKWHRVLIDMLRACGYLRIAAVSMADLHLRRASLFDLYMDAFACAVEEICRQGLAKKYRQVSGNLTVLRGRILFARDAQMNHVHRERVFTAHQQYDQSNRFNQILRCATGIVSRVARDGALRCRADALGLWLEHVDDAVITAETFRSLVFDRNTERYRFAIQLARMIILNYQPDVRKGGHDVLAILFDMNDLFEAYVFRQLRAAAATMDGVRVRGQPSAAFWESESGDHARGIQADIVVTVDSGGPNAETVVLDTKWKMPTAGYPDDADLKQMYVYNLQYGARRSYLVYPRVDARGDVTGAYEAPRHEPERVHYCGMWFARLLDGDRLNRRLGQELLGQVRPQ